MAYDDREGLRAVARWSDLTGADGGELTTADRRAADQELVEVLAVRGFEGPAYERFEAALAAYALARLPGMIRTGAVSVRIAGAGPPVRPTTTELDAMSRDAAILDDLTDMTVARALVLFRRRAMIGGEWRPGGGASLTTYFIGACKLMFRAEMSGYRAALARDSRSSPSTPEQFAGVADGTPEGDPASTVVANQQVREELDRLEEPARTMVAMTLDGHSQRKIADRLGTSERAVEGVLRRWRRKAQRRRSDGGDEHDQR
ncbi:sigma factor-like helix-turn-helix DNA-binding protein [Actinoplanes sp. NPDC049548]|uniref:sigma factor-like helix-turn-helix DNA-binding protein n=1 Tax=Actinoplanes sp. NPDC049548 TaxID=3155152 RepID=UPI00343A3683